MKTTFLSITLLALTLFSISDAEAQVITDLSSPVIKKEYLEDSHSEEPITLDDFSFQGSSENESGLVGAIRTKPGLALLSSALIPGSGQAANNKWVRAGVYFAAELAGVAYHLTLQSKARKQERDYEAYVHQNWSVMAYAEWLVNYSEINDLDNNWQELRDHIANKQPDFSNTPNDWDKVDIDLLHRVETSTPYVFNGDDAAAIDNRTNFSHELPRYGSQQFYELVSKYYQFQPGWQDWYSSITTNGSKFEQQYYQYMWNGNDEPFGMFYTGRDLAEEFNDNYRVAGNILKLLLVNHVVSAFDAYFTVKLKNSRLEADANLLRMEQVSLTWHF